MWTIKHTDDFFFKPCLCELVLSTSVLVMDIYLKNYFVFFSLIFFSLTVDFRQAVFIFALFFVYPPKIYPLCCVSILRIYIWIYACAFVWSFTYMKDFDLALTYLKRLNFFFSFPFLWSLLSFQITTEAFLINISWLPFHWISS